MFKRVSWLVLIFVAFFSLRDFGVESQTATNSTLPPFTFPISNAPPANGTTTNGTGFTTGATTTPGVTAGVPCVDYAAQDCIDNANLCTDPTYKSLMEQKCPKTCGYCNGGHGGGNTTCVDNDSRCAVWVQNGFCTDDFYTIETRELYCQKSCNLCPETDSSTNCKDNSDQCVNWVRNGFCTDSFYADQWKEYCQKSCNLC